MIRRAATDTSSILHGVVVSVLGLVATQVRADSSKEATWSAASGGNGHTYRVVATSAVISRAAANAAAMAAGGYLATITSPEENAFVFSLIDDQTYWHQTLNNHGPWIGAYQPDGSPEPSGGWTWVTQTGVSIPEVFGYSNWGPGEPSNQTKTLNGTAYNENGMDFHHVGTGRAATWNDQFSEVGSGLNTYTMSYVIEFSAPAAPVVRVLSIAENGVCQLGFTNEAGALFTVLMTTNLSRPLSSWSDLGAATEVSAGQFEFTDTQATDGSCRFYRLRSQ